MVDRLVRSVLTEARWPSSPIRLRAELLQLQQALANRFELANHGVLVAGLLATSTHSTRPSPASMPESPPPPSPTPSSSNCSHNPVGC
jgi:hypothetical protein